MIPSLRRSPDGCACQQPVLVLEARRLARGSAIQCLRQLIFSCSYIFHFDIRRLDSTNLICAKRDHPHQTGGCQRSLLLLLRCRESPLISCTDLFFGPTMILLVAFNNGVMTVFFTRGKPCRGESAGVAAVAAAILAAVEGGILPPGMRTLHAEVTAKATRQSTGQVMCSAW